MSKPRDVVKMNADNANVWLDYSQAELDAAYGPKAMAKYAPNQEQVVGRMERASVLMRARLGEPKLMSYGDSTIETISYYPAPIRNAPIHVHVHGGAWRQRKAETILFPAEAFVGAGIGFAMLDFIGSNERGWNFEVMLDQVCKGLAWLARHAVELGGAPDRLHLSGFSSGAHLASAALVRDWTSYGLTMQPYKSAVLFSGLYDLRPLRLTTSTFDYLHIDDTIEDAMSAQRHCEKFEPDALIAVGTAETPELTRHAQGFASALERCGKPVKHLVCEGYNHYEMMESFGHPYSPLGHAAIQMALR
jgi:arylformamidase